MSQLEHRARLASQVSLARLVTRVIAVTIPAQVGTLVSPVDLAILDSPAIRDFQVLVQLESVAFQGSRVIPALADSLDILDLAVRRDLLDSLELVDTQETLRAIQVIQDGLETIPAHRASQAFQADLVIAGFLDFQESLVLAV